MKTAYPTLSSAFFAFALGAILLIPCMGGCSRAEDTQRTPQPDRFAQIDVDSDGKIVAEEFQAAFPNMGEQAFVIIDKNADKGIDRVEWAEFIENHGRSPREPDHAPVMNNIPGDPLIPPVDSNDLPLMRPPAQ